MKRADKNDNLIRLNELYRAVDNVMAATEKAGNAKGAMACRQVLGVLGDCIGQLRKAAARG